MILKPTLPALRRLRRRGFIVKTFWDRAFVGASTAAAIPGPDTITGLVTWYAAYKESAYANNDAVGTFHDWSGNAHDATAITTSRPAYKTGIIASKPALYFDGTTSHLTLPDFFTGLTGAEVFLVLKGDSGQGSGSLVGLWGMPRTSDNENYPWTDQMVYDGFYSTVRKNCGNSGLAANWYKSWHTYNVTSVAAEYTARVNGTQFFTTATNVPGMLAGTNSTNGYRLGQSAAGASFFFQGWIAELIMYNAKLSGSDRTTVYTYITSKYGI